MVDDPSAHPDPFPTEEAQEKERLRLFRIIEDLMLSFLETTGDALADLHEAEGEGCPSPGTAWGSS